jgi:hypothetical protein
MLRSRLGRVVVVFVAAFGAVPAAAQTSADSVRRANSGISRAWLSVGVGGGNSRFGNLAGRAAASIAVTPVLVFSLEGNGVGDFDRQVSSINLMVGAQSSDPTGFVFASAGLANVSCGSGCAHQTGIAFDVGYHAGWRYAGGGVAAFVVRAPHGTNSEGVVLTLDVGSLAGVATDVRAENSDAEGRARLLFDHIAAQSA